MSTMGALAAEFPPSDQALWTLHRDGMVSARAVRQLAAAPDSPETLELLLNRGRLDDALRVLRTIVDSRPAQLESALALVGRSSYRFRQNQPRGYATTLRGIVAAARRRLPALPREEAARIARELALLENGLTGGGSAGWQQQLARLIAEYPDTEMARLVQVDEMTAGRVSEAQLEQLAEFARTHPRSTVGAKALYNLGFQLANNVAMSGLEPRGADPAPRFLRVVAIANQLQDGSFPPCEWVRQAPSLVTGFFAAAPVYGDGSIDRMLDAASAFAKAHFIRPDGQPDPDAVEYLITKKMADLFDRKGEPIVGVERVLMSLERGAAGHDAAKFMRASFYVSARQSRPPQERAGLTRKAIETLTSLHQETDGLYERKSLAALASLQFAEGALAEARASYQSYLSSYPDSPWAWVAALRVGQCATGLGDWAAADDVYRRVTATFVSNPVAWLLGQELGARASEALGNMDEALLEHQRALDAWGLDAAPAYTLPGNQRADAGEPGIAPSVVTREALADRVSQLARTLGMPGGRELERGRWQLAMKQRGDALRTFEQVIANFAQSPIVPEARYLSHRATFEDALDRLDRDKPQAGAAQAEGELAMLAKLPFDPAVGAARVARAALWWIRGETGPADAELRSALDDWHAHQQPAALPAGLDRDVADIRAVVFRPQGGGVFAGDRWNAFSWPSMPPAFAVAKADVQVLLPGGDTLRVTVREPLLGASENAVRRRRRHCHARDHRRPSRRHSQAPTRADHGDAEPADRAVARHPPAVQQALSGTPGALGRLGVRDLPDPDAGRVPRRRSYQSRSPGHDWLLRGDGRPGEDQRGVAGDRPGRPMDHLVTHLSQLTRPGTSALKATSSCVSYELALLQAVLWQSFQNHRRRARATPHRPPRRRGPAAAAPASCPPCCARRSRSSASAATPASDRGRCGSGPASTRRPSTAAGRRAPIS